jgi:nucleotide-binding universal stress UspA family protein
MNAFKRILCPVDFSAGSRHALDQAVALARWDGGAVTALHVVPPIPYSDPLMSQVTVLTPEDLQQIREELEAFVADEVGAVPVATAVVQGNAVGAILREAETLPADLIVLGTHGRSGFERFILGSVTERVLRKAVCPVLTVPPRSADVVPLGPPGFSRILCPVDFSPVSETVIASADRLARQVGARLTVMHVVEPMPVSEPVMIGGSGGVALEAVARNSGALRLHELAPSGGYVHEIVTNGKPYREILKRAHEDKSDLIVIGVHSGVGDRLGFFGSTTNHIVREAACPVLSLRV